MSLRLNGLAAGYGRGTTVDHIDLAVTAGTVHAIVGHNGAGKTTLLHTIAGLHPTRGGTIDYHGRDITSWPSHRRARAGIALVPQGRRTFPHLSVAEHLHIPTRRRRSDPTGWTTDQLLDLFPQLATRLSHRGGQLSGGEQQMLAIARALRCQPRLLLLDEPTEGLAPPLAQRIADLVTTLARTGLTILLTSPHPHLPITVADHISVLASGHLTCHMSTPELRSNPEPLHHALTPATNPAQPSTTTAGPVQARGWARLLPTPTGGNHER